MPIPFLRPKPRPPAAFQGQLLPGASANPVSKALFWWISPILKVGYSRPLQAEDLWTLTDNLLCETQADRVEALFQQRLPPSRRMLGARADKADAGKGKSASLATSTSLTHDDGDTPLEERKLGQDDEELSTAAGSMEMHDLSKDPVSLGADEEKVRLERAHLGSNDGARQREEGAVVEATAGLLPTVGGMGMLPDEEALAVPTLGVAGERSGAAVGAAPETPAELEEKPSLLPKVDASAAPVAAATAEKDAKGKSKGKDGDADLDPALVKAYGKRKARKVQSGRYAEEGGKVYDQSLVRALYFANWFTWWKAFSYVLAGSALQVTAPLVTRQIINQMTIAYEYHRDSALPAPKSVGYGIGLAVALFVMEEAASIFTYQGQQRGAVMGFQMRAGLIALISRKSMKLSGKSRIEMTNGRMTTMVSADCSFLDFAGPMTVTIAVEPIQIVVGIALLIYTLGYSALVGLAVLVLAVPFQSAMFVRMITYRQAQMKVVDTRVRLLTEIINNIRAVKLYAYENLFGEKVSALRRKELAKLRRNGLNRSFMISTMNFVPVLATVLTFITYGLSGHPLNASIIFSGLQYFNVLRQPITFLPMAFTAVSDAAVAVGRIGVLLRSEELDHDLHINPSLPNSVSAHGEFQFDSVNPPDTSAKGGRGKNGAGHGAPDRAAKREEAKRRAAEKKAAKERKKQGLPPLEKEVVDETEGVPFALRDIHLEIPRGALVCVVGRVGTGKTALLSGLINEMKQIEGRVEFGGKVGYVPQQAWVQSGTIRDNITFGTDLANVDMRRVNEVIDACALRTEMNMWADGDQTKIGEKGITLSGGQRQRICLARAAYDDSSEVVLLDDPLSAVDAHVGHHLLQRCILSGPLAHRTRILVTHHLDVLPRADMVLVMDRDASGDGRIIQQGTYQELREQAGVFRSLMEEFGANGQDEKAEEEVKEKKEEVTKGEGGGKLLLDEEREVGAVSWKVYKKYGQAMGGLRWILPVATFLCANQAAQVGNNLMLGYWSGRSIPGLSEGGYMGAYAGLGSVVAIFTWLGSYTMIVSCLRASFTMFDGAWKAVMRSPTGWHDRTPTGRIISRLSKDIEMLDDRLSMMLNQLCNSALAVVGTFALVVYTFPWLGLIFIPLGFAYYTAASYYRATSREVKRIDSINRSMIYTSFGEQLNGLAVIRAFGKQTSFQRKLQESVNWECQAYIITITIQRWLGVRLDLFSYTLVFLIAVFASIFRTSVSPSKLGVVLTYSIQAAGVFGQLVQMFAQVEQEMNNVERVQYYNDLEIEAAETLPTDPPVDQWPVAGAVEFRDVKLRYRSTLPLVLKGLTFDIKPGEKIGIIGRTGAGKSSMAQALFRTVELDEGSILIDGRDLRKMGLETVRQRLAIIPQDAFLFAGTVRENIDPLHVRSDAELNDLIKLIHRSSASPGTNDKFKLDATVLNEGQNFSAGERQLLALVRAVARRCKVVMLDEATSSVDPETDATIQRIIQTELADVTLISIAHRLQTVAYYDRILVLDHGEVAEFDTPLKLFDNPEGHFRSLCETKGLGRADLVKIQEDAANAVQGWQSRRVSLS